MATQLNDWLSVDKISGTGNAEITLTASSYEELVERTTSLKIQGISANAILNVRQNALVPIITLSTSKIESSFKGATYNVVVTSNVDWTLESDSNWYTISQNSGTKGNTTLIITMGENEGTDNKEGTVSFLFGDMVLATLSIVQEAWQPLPKADNRIYYTGDITINSHIIYGTNAEYVGYGTEDGVNYIEYDRPITHINGVFAEGSSIERLSLPSTLLYLTSNGVSGVVNGEHIFYGQAFHTDTLQEVDFGGNELYIGNYSFSSLKLQKFNLPKTVRVVGRCGFGGKDTIQDFGTDTLNIGADMKLIAAGAFSGMGKINTINFYGMIPPTFEVWFNGIEDVTPFDDINPNCEVHIPIGADYSSLYTDGGLPSTCTIIADLTAEEPTTYETSLWLDGGHTRINPNDSCFVYFYDAETNEYSSTYSTYHNTTTEIINKTVTIKDIPLVIEVRGGEIGNVSWSQKVGGDTRKIMCIKGKNIYRTEFICSNDRLLSNKGFYYQRACSYDKQYDGICWELRAGNYNASWADIQNVTIKSKAYDKYDNYQETTTIKVRELY